MDPVQCAICNRILRNASALNLHVESGCVQGATDDGVRKSPMVDRMRRKVKDKAAAAAGAAAAVTQAGAPVPGPPGAAGSEAGATASGAGAAVTQAGAPVPGPPGASVDSVAGPPGAAAGN